MRKQIIIICLIFIFPFLLFSQQSPIPIYKTSPSNLLKTFSFPSKEILTIELNLTYETFEIKEIYGTDIAIDILGNNNKLLPNVECSNNILNINSTATENTIGDLCTIIIYIPRKFNFQNFLINITNTKNHSIQDIVLNDIDSKSISITTKNSNISIKNFKNGQNLKLITESGNINLENIKTTQLTAISSSGKIKLNNFIGEYFLVNSNGIIKCQDISANFFDIFSKSSDITLSLNTAPLAHSLIKTETGYILVFIPENENFNLFVHSTNGTFFDKLLNKRFSPRRQYEMSYNKGGAVIQIESFSGNIEIDSF